jgi:hypothetical protein
MPTAVAHLQCRRDERVRHALRPLLRRFITIASDEHRMCHCSCFIVAQCVPQSISGTHDAHDIASELQARYVRRSQHRLLCNSTGRVSE